MQEEAKLIYKTRTAVIRYLGDHILHYDILANAEVVVEDAEEYIQIQSTFATERPVKNLTDIRKVKSISIAARDLLKSSSIANIHAGSALVVNSPLSRIIGNFFMQINRPDYPVRLFNDEKNALDWLRSLP